MFTYLRRIFPQRQFFIFFVALYIAGYIHPATRTTFKNLIAPYQTQIMTYSDAIISVLTVTAIIGLILEFGKLYELVHFRWAEFSVVWIINLILILKFLGIQSVSNNWINMYSESYELYLQPLVNDVLSILSVLVWGVPFVAVIVFGIIAHEKGWIKGMQDYIRSHFPPEQKEREEEKEPLRVIKK